MRPGSEAPNPGAFLTKRGTKEGKPPTERPVPMSDGPPRLFPELLGNAPYKELPLRRTGDFWGKNRG